MTKRVEKIRGATATDAIDVTVQAASVVSVYQGETFYSPSATDGYTVVNTPTSFSLTWAGTQPAEGSTYVVVYNVNPGFLLKGTDFVKSAFVSALRAAFSAQPFLPIYQYVADDKLTGISILESFPKRPLRVPALVVNTGPGSMSRTTLDSEDFLKETVNAEDTLDGVYAWGHCDVSARIQILSVKDTDRRKLTDLTSLFCRHLFTDKLSAFGIGYKIVSIEGEREMDWQGQTLYLNTISIPCYTEWQVFYPVALVDVINSISIDTIAEL